MDIHHIRYFLSVCETLNFTRAAELCQVTQPALSRAIQQLEHEVGGQLLRRERNLTHLTDLGVLMKPRFEQILKGVDGVRQKIKRHLTIARTDLNVGVMSTISPLRFVEQLRQVRSRLPEANLCLHRGQKEQLLERIGSGELDSAIVAMAGDRLDGLECRPLYREGFVVAMPTGHRLAGFAELTIADLNGENYLGRLNCEHRAQIGQCIIEAGCTVKCVSESDRDDWIQNLVASGVGVTIVPEFNAVTAGIATRPIADPALHRTVCTVAQDRGRQSTGCARFLATLHNGSAGSDLEADIAVAA